MNEQNEENVINPIQDKRDLVDKSIDAYETFVDTKDHATEYDKEQANKYRNLALLCYVPFISLYFVVSKEYKKSEYLKFHVNQGLDLTIYFVIVYIIGKILTIIFTRNSLIINDVPFIIEIIVFIVSSTVFMYMLFGMFNTAAYCSKELPIIGKFKILK